MRYGYGQKSSFETMVQGFITLVFVATIGAIITRCVTSSSGADQEEAEKGAREFAQKMGLKVSGISCAKTDSDGDGYVSCTLAVQNPDGSTKMESIECARTLTLNDGCRMQKPGVRQR